MSPGRAAAGPSTGPADSKNIGQDVRTNPTPAPRQELGVPQDIEAEEIVIGSLLLVPALTAEVAKVVRPHDFHKPAAADAFAVLAAASREGLTLKPEQVAAKVDNLTQEDLLAWQNRVSSSASAVSYARRVRAAKTKRMFVGALADADLAARNGSSIEEVMEAHTARIAPISARVLASDPAVVLTLADVEPERVRWLWPGRIPFGKVSTLEGRPDLGKSTVVIDITASATTGKPMPGTDESCAPVSVLLLVAEDGAADTIRPRADAAGADCSRVHILDRISDLDSDGREVLRPPAIPRDVRRMAKVIQDTGAQLVVIDPLSAFMGVRDSSSDVEVRGALTPLNDLAEESGAAIVLVRHLRKAGGSAMDAGAGSIAISGNARSGMLVAADPEDETGRRRVLATFKHNLTTSQDSLAYELVSSEEHGCARVEWGESTSITADQLLAPREENLGPLSREVLAVVNGHPQGVRAGEVAKAVGADSKQVGTYLGRLYDSGRITKLALGLYAPVGKGECVGGVESEESDSTDSTQPTLNTDGGNP